MSEDVHQVLHVGDLCIKAGETPKIRKPDRDWQFLGATSESIANDLGIRLGSLPIVVNIVAKQDELEASWTPGKEG